ncbi:hypothetical protein YPPY60_1532 [Yersinia pestis PY-60]|uniref:Uncharacterized protein n=1 Tax=Yersinia pestis biovar Orientalis str. IP275 TaxID=373665 RepID=A0AAV3BFF0_YERPE|nr:hypothetical protein YpAngola_A1504 [Yersinia pestis Angola]EDR34412.1 hypothetical protein YPIP275_4770 [Yersinia pestis biovar Orientalis str. IP275]EDR40996.1 hypothetical protein YpF1991016_0402 [Yersinia pestis biovar Orientalis str. F1991016]EDR58608.1 hypothetical protein YpMG051020_0650 [Yersinia pestis biovar Orientalis str. MG05-1020]EDR66587.1 hypothetical protein YpK1973002_1253 [Yersinia pestis biovar Mediaevalis str. K1973002]EFA46369.1 conserved hypothetical protein [Yersinia
MPQPKNPVIKLVFVMLDLQNTKIFLYDLQIIWLFITLST